MSVFDDELDKVLASKFPANPCKFLRIWRDGGDKELYVQVMEVGMWLEHNGHDVELKDIAAVLNKSLGMSVTVNDVWKHRHGSCLGCRRLKEAGYDLSEL